MTHIVYIVMMLTANGTPQAMGTEATLEMCNTIVAQSASADFHRTFWYCQPAVANVTLGPTK